MNVWWQHQRYGCPGQQEKIGEQACREDQWPTGIPSKLLGCEVEHALDGNENGNEEDRHGFGTGLGEGGLLLVNAAKDSFC